VGPDAPAENTYGRRSPRPQDIATSTGKKWNSDPPPPLLPLLPDLPQAIRANPRNELRRRASPSSSLSGFSLGMLSRPPSPGFGSLSPMPSPMPSQFSVNGEAPAAQCATASEPRVDDFLAVPPTKEEESAYVLTLRTTSPIEEQMLRLRESVSNSRSNDVFPAAQIVIFPSLPAVHHQRITMHLDALAQRMCRFELSNGKIARNRSGEVVVGLSMGEKEIRRMFVSLRTTWWDWLSEDDKSFNGMGWFVLGENEPGVDKIVGKVQDGGMRGWATGLCLWEKVGVEWCKVREFGFTSNGDAGMEGGEVRNSI